MADLPFTPAAPGLAERLFACLDVEGKIPRALDALGPIAARDVLLIDGPDDPAPRRSEQLAGIGGRVRTTPITADGRLPDAADHSADVIVGLWSTFRAPDAACLAEVDRVLRPDGRLLVLLDYGRDDVSRLRGDLSEYGVLSRRDGPYLRGGYKVRVVHCFWTFGSQEETTTFLDEAFGAIGREVAAALKRPRLSYNVAVYHRGFGDAS